jgi:hypothetical protein
MAVPSLIHKAALTLFHNPHMQPEDVSVPYGDFSPYVTVIQRSWRRRTFLHCYVHSVYDVLSKAYRVPVLPDFQPGHAFGPRALRGGRRYLGQHRGVLG